MSETTSAGASTTEAAPGAAGQPSGETAPPAAGDTTQQPGAAGDGTSATAPAGDGTTTPAGAPEAYSDFTVPEGVVLDATVVDGFKGLAKDLGLSQEHAQKVADVIAQQAKASAEASQSAVQAEITRMHGVWAAEAKADPEIGGDKFDENMATAKAAMEATTTPQLRMLLDRSGLGNNPEVIRHFLKIAPAFREDKHVPGSKAPPGAGKSAAEILYPTKT